MKNRLKKRYTVDRGNMKCSKDVICPKRDPKNSLPVLKTEKLCTKCNRDDYYDKLGEEIDKHPIGGRNKQSTDIAKATKEMLKGLSKVQDVTQTMKEFNHLDRNIVNVTDLLDEKQKEKLAKWLKNKKEKNVGAVGGRYTFEITPTGIGDIIKVKDSMSKSNSELDLTDIESW